MPRLEKLLLDGDIDPELGDYLKAVGFDVQLAPRDNPIIQDDVEVLRFARRRRRILVCHDKHADRATQFRLFPELYHHGGRILRIGGDSSQSLLTALGKVLIHYEDWSAWFKDHPSGGRVVVYSTKLSTDSAEEFMARHMRHVYRGTDIPPIPARRRGRRQPRPAIVPSEQLRLPD